MDRFAKVLDLWATLNTNLRMRDRSVKALQYGCQMLLGFYGSKFSADTAEALKTLRRTASNSRRAFWLLKSVNHVNSLVTMIPKLAQQFSWVLLFEAVEQIFLALYYLTENVVFFIRVKVLKMTEEEIDPYVNWTWFWGDLACFLAAALKFVTSLMDLNSDRIPDKESVQKIRKLCFDTAGMLIALFELLVSADYMHIFRSMIGRDLGDGLVGLCGVLSSSLIIADGAAKLALT